ncbi:MAG: dephospho-CoA kinase, partial [Chitinophagaceae bacterium]
MLKVGITGGIGSGKSTVARLFGLLNIPVYDADGASKRLYYSNKLLQSQLKQHFGDDIYELDVLNRKKLANIVFSNPLALQLLNSLVHPLTIRDAEDWMDLQESPYIIKEAALLFESKSAQKLDVVIGVKAPEDIRISRAMQRDGVNEANVRHRLNHQMDEA